MKLIVLVNLHGLLIWKSGGISIANEFQKIISKELKPCWWKCNNVDTSSFALKTNLASLKTEADKFDIEKLVSTPVDLSKLSDVTKNDVVKKAVYDKLVSKTNNIDTSGFVLKTKCDTNKIQN